MKFGPASLGCLFLASCSTGTLQPDLSIPAPAPTVRRVEALATAYAYTQVAWTPEKRHQHHGPDRQGILVHTPDTSLRERGFSGGWWQAGVPAKGMPYQWGGFDTPQMFLESLRRGEYAGDISTRQKRVLLDDGTSAGACGIDCSGFVSRCWRLSRSWSTRELHQICDRLPAWEDLRPGDIILNDRHVLLFARWADTPGEALYYEAGPNPVWRVNAARIGTARLKGEGYAPWRYRGIRD